MKHLHLLSLVRQIRLVMRSRYGNFSIMTALLALPLAAMTGLAVDISHALAIKAELQEAADAATLNAVRIDSQMEAMRRTGSLTLLFARLNAEAEKRFQESVGSRLSREASPVAISEMKLAAPILTARLTYRARMKTNFLRAIGITSLNLSGRSEANSASVTYSTVHLLLDNSPSMGLAATDYDRTALKSAVLTLENKRKLGRGGCIFACHDLNADPLKNQDYYSIARTLSIPIRLDLVKRSASLLTFSIRQMRVQTNQIGVRLYSFGAFTTDAANGYAAQGDTTYDMDLLNARISAIDLSGVPAGRPHDGTNLYGMLKRFQADIPQQTEGLNPAKPKQVLMLVLDGVTNISPFAKGTCSGTVERYGRPDAQCHAPVNEELCQMLKSRGIPIAIVFVPPVPLPEDENYMSLINPFANRIESNAEACASPGLFMKAEDQDSITEAMKSLFLKATMGPKLAG